MDGCVCDGPTIIRWTIYETRNKTPPHQPTPRFTYNCVIGMERRHLLHPTPRACHPHTHTLSSHLPMVCVVCGHNQHHDPSSTHPSKKSFQHNNKPFVGCFGGESTNRRHPPLSSSPRILTSVITTTTQTLSTRTSHRQWWWWWWSRRNIYLRTILVLVVGGCCTLLVDSSSHSYCRTRTIITTPKRCSGFVSLLLLLPRKSLKSSLLPLIQTYPTALKYHTNIPRSQPNRGEPILGRRIFHPIIPEWKLFCDSFGQEDSPLHQHNMWVKLDSPPAQRNKHPIWQVLSSEIFPHLTTTSSSSGSSSSSSSSNTFALSSDSIPNVVVAEDDEDEKDMTHHTTDPLTTLSSSSSPSSSATTTTTTTTALRILEIAAGCGVHTQYFCLEMIKAGWNNFIWYPSDPDASSRASILSYLEEADLALIDDTIPPTTTMTTIHPNHNIYSMKPKTKTTTTTTTSVVIIPPLKLTLDVHGIQEMETKQILLESSTTALLDLILCINMIHITPLEATMGLMKTAQETLRSGGFLYCYGPYKVNGITVESNRRFDRTLRLRDPSWGVRDLEYVQQVALDCGLDLIQTIAMPFNNLSLVFRKR